MQLFSTPSTERPARGPIRVSLPNHRFVDEEGLRVFRRGRCVGSETFRTEQLERLEGKLGEHHSGELCLETAKAKEERIIAEELSRLGWTDGELAGRRKNDPGKMAVAVRLRRETTLSVKQIATRVHLGTSQTENKRLHQAMKAVPAIEPSQETITH